MTIAAVVTAAGSGTRLGAGVPKALVPIHGRPLVAWAVDSIRTTADAVVITAPAAHLEHMRQAVPGAIVVPGAHTRQGSVAAGLAALDLADDDIVLIHDAARAFQPPEVLQATVAAVQAGADGAIPVVPVVDTLMGSPLADGTVGATVDREHLVAVQTPQTFRAGVALAAHRQATQQPADSTPATDDASLVRAAGYRVVAVPGHEWGFKVTRRTDLPLAMHIAADIMSDEPPTAGAENPHGSHT